MSLDDFRDEVAAIADILNASSVLAWDMRTMMPAGGTATRGQQMATLAIVARERLLSNGMRRALDAAETATMRQPEDSIDRRAIAQVREAIAWHTQLPDDLVRARNALKASAQAAWAEARSQSDFSIFAPYLAETITLARRQAEAIGFVDHPHDALLSAFEPGETGSSLAPLFAALRQGLSPLVRVIAERAPPQALPMGPFPVADQHAFGQRLAARFGYDFDRGRLDPTVHPFELAITRNDVRITTRYNPAAIEVGLKATMHETGHGLYEQNIDPALTRTALSVDLIALGSMGGTSLGAHESQSRLWENHVGRRRGFWALIYPELRAAFPAALDTVSLDQFYRAFNRVAPGPIRVEADELTYDFHIMLRTELERALIDGSLAVADLQQAWNSAMRDDLGVTVANDAEGVLQDIHWSMGQFGSFCSYTVGNVMAAQVWQAATAANPAIPAAIDAGSFLPLREALSQGIWRHGRRYDRNELLQAMSGRALDPAPYVAYLTDKYRALYDL